MSFTNLHTVLAVAGPMPHEVPGLQETIFKSNILNFIILVILIAWLVKKFKPLTAITKKISDIKNTIANAEENSKIAENKFHEIKEAVASTEEEVKLIVDESKQVAEKISAKIKDEIHTETEELNKKADKAIVNAHSKGQSELEKEVTIAAFIVAEDHIKNVIDDRLHRKYIDEFINDLSDLKV